MTGIKAALWVEFLKVRKSRMLWITIAFFAFVALMMGLLMLIAIHPEYAGKSAIFSSKATFVKRTDWTGFFGLLLQIILTLGIIGYGVVTGWIFGREFSDRVINDILALPVSRITIVTAKFIVVGIWCILLMLTIYFVGLVIGIAISLPGWNAPVIIHWSWIYMRSGLLTILSGSPVGLVASYGRGYLLAIAYVLLTLITTQFVFLGVPGLAPYFPWAIPALSSGLAGPGLPHAGILCYSILLLTCLAGFYGTAAWWKYADHN